MSDRHCATALRARLAEPQVGHPASAQTQTHTPRRSRMGAPPQSSAYSDWGGVGKVFWVLLIFAILGIEPRGPGMLGEHSTTGIYGAQNLQGSNTFTLEKKGFHI